MANAVRCVLIHRPTYGDDKTHLVAHRRQHLRGGFMTNVARLARDLRDGTKCIFVRERWSGHCLRHQWVPAASRRDAKVGCSLWIWSSILLQSVELYEAKWLFGTSEADRRSLVDFIQELWGSVFRSGRTLPCTKFVVSSGPGWQTARIEWKFLMDTKQERF